MINSNIFVNELVDLALSKFGVEDTTDKEIYVEFYFTDSGMLKVKITENNIPVVQNAN